MENVRQMLANSSVKFVVKYTVVFNTIEAIKGKKNWQICKEIKIKQKKKEKTKKLCTKRYKNNC